MHYRNFDIIIDEPTADGYPVRASCEIFGEARSFLELDFESNEFNQGLEELENLQTNFDSLTTFGKNLYHAVFNGEIETIFQRSFGSASQEKSAGVRVRLKITSPELATLPWEAIYFPNEGCFMGTSLKCPLVRYPELSLTISNLQVAFPISMLVVIPDSITPYPDLDVNRERRNLEEATKGLSGQLEITWLEGRVTWQNIRDQLTEKEFNCFHFIGHGEFQNDQGMLLVNSEDGEIDYVDERRIGAVFKNLESMKLVVLNSCHGASVSSSVQLSGLAPTLVSAGVPAVVAMKYGIDDQAAILFGREFYRKLFLGNDRGRIDMAMAHARNTLSVELSEPRDFCTPVLYLRSRQGVLFESITEKTYTNIPWTREARDSAKATYETYKDYHRATGDSEAAARMSHIQRLDILRRRGQLMATATVLFFFLLSWVGAFDLLGLDTRIEMLTVRMGEQIARTPFHEDLLLVTAKKEIESSWRATSHPQLIDKLSRAGAKVIAFDMAFEKSSEYDPPLVAAIKNAQARGTSVLCAVERIEEGREQIVPEIREAMSSPPSSICMGRKLEVTRSVPLVVMKKGAGEMQNYFALSLSAYSAFTGGASSYEPTVDLAHKQIMLPTGNGTSKSIPFAETIAPRGEHLCGMISPGDIVCDMILAPLATEVLRDPQHKKSYQDILGQSVAELTPLMSGKVILVGGEHGDKISEKRGGSQTRYGVEFHAEALNSLLNNISIRPLGTVWQFVIVIFLGFLGGFIRGRFYSVSRMKRMAAGFLVVFLFMSTSLILYAGYHLLVNILYPISAFVLAYYAVGRIDRRIPI